MSEFTHHRIDADTVDFLVSPSSEEVTGAENLAEAKETVAIRLKRLAGGWTKLDYACDLELRFGTSHGASKYSIDRRLEEIAEESIYFQRLVPLEDYGVEDGQCLGHDLLWQASSAKKRVERLKKVDEKSRALGELCFRHSWMEAMLTTALQGSLNMNQTVETKLVCLSEKVAAQIGMNLVQILMTEQLAEAGVNEWRVQNRAIKESMEDQIWFEPMAVVLGKGIVKTAPWGLMARVIVGATLSVADLAVDLIVLRQFWNGSQKLVEFRNAQLSSLAALIVIQLILVECSRTERWGCRGY
ncbi:hypothetical protein TL16_g12449 [Triparma laevis f. inornata]|uniref:Uncharacterized protein n=2 Tax=Triparma laevis TaxID=1534972 RepID=A0A9W6Z996_9STRA|nr:hypothetical protein TrLO_g10357 [Triparma laevis f. longispina]GMH92779.1 hypothetical protein TL16_g12449 [Triparma laevis f. inornata]